MSEAQFQIQSLLGAVSRAPRSLLMLDYDGTLAPFHANRKQASPYPGVRSLLQEIHHCGNTRVAIISGRDACEVVSLLGIEPRPEVWGLHGLQRWKTHGEPEVLAIEKRVVAALAAARDWLSYQNLEESAEFKVGSIALHWRGASEMDAESIRSRALLGWWPIAKGSGLDLLEFDGGVEIRTPGANKGDAVRAILDEMPLGTPAVYLGDDVTDEAAFHAINGSGLSVLVRAQKRLTTAQAWLRPPDDVLKFLGGWLEASRRASSNSATRNCATGNCEALVSA